jgi:hypothetical protein
MEITPEVIEALRKLRKTYLYPAEQAAFDTLDNAGVFAAIDEAAGYDTAPESQQVSKCTCPVIEGYDIVNGGIKRGRNHSQGCPGDPAEWGDMATRPVTG